MPVKQFTRIMKRSDRGQDDILSSAPNMNVSARPRKRGYAADEVRDLNLSPVIAVLVTIALLGFSAWGTRWLEIITADPRPFTLFFLIPVAFGAAYFGIRGGIVTALISLVIARLFLFPQTRNVFLLSTVSDYVEVGALSFGTLTVAVVIGRLRSVLVKLRQANTDLRDSEQRRQNFSREVLLAVTGGVLELCTEQEIKEKLPGESDITVVLREPIDASTLRHLIIGEMKDREITTVRIDDLCTAATEAATNAIKHGNGGRALVWFSPSEVSVLIEDNGPGISPSELARATLERGFSTRVSLGMGYYMMIESVDRMALSTSSGGTWILLTVSGSEKSTIEQNILDHYTTN